MTQWPQYIPLMANPYNILTQISEDAKSFTVRDLKNAFFFIPVHFSSQYLFAFHWTNPDLSQMQQYTWTILPQRCPDSPHLFTQALEKELRKQMAGGTQIRNHSSLSLTSGKLVKGYMILSIWGR